MKFLVEWHNLLDSRLHGTLLVRLAARPRSFVAVAALLRIANDHIELGNLVGVLTRGWNFNRS